MALCKVFRLLRWGHRWSAIIQITRQQYSELHAPSGAVTAVLIHQRYDTTSRQKMFWPDLSCYGNQCFAGNPSSVIDRRKPWLRALLVVGGVQKKCRPLSATDQSLQCGSNISNFPQSAGYHSNVRSNLSLSQKYRHTADRYSLPLLDPLMCHCYFIRPAAPCKQTKNPT